MMTYHPLISHKFLAQLRKMMEQKITKLGDNWDDIVEQKPSVKELAPTANCFLFGGHVIPMYKPSRVAEYHHNDSVCPHNQIAIRITLSPMRECPVTAVQTLTLKKCH